MVKGTLYPTEKSHSCLKCTHCRLQFSFIPKQCLSVQPHPKTNSPIKIFCGKGMWLQGSKKKVYISREFFKTGGEGLRKYAPLVCPLFDGEEGEIYEELDPSPIF